MAEITLPDGVQQPLYDERRELKVPGVLQMAEYADPLQVYHHGPQAVGHIRAWDNARIQFGIKPGSLSAEQINEVLRLYQDLKVKFDLYVKTRDILDKVINTDDLCAVRESVRLGIDGNVDLGVVEAGAMSQLSSYGFDVQAMKAGHARLIAEINVLFSQLQQLGVVFIENQDTFPANRYMAPLKPLVSTF